MITALTLLKTHLFKCAQDPPMKTMRKMAPELILCRSSTALVLRLYRYQGHVSAALVLGGVDFNGPHLFTVSIQHRGLLLSSAACWKQYSAGAIFSSIASP